MLQSIAQPFGVDANDRIDLRVIARCPSEYSDRDGGLLDLVVLALQALLDAKAKELSGSGRGGKDWRSQNPLKLGLNLFWVGCHRPDGIKPTLHGCKPVAGGYRAGVTPLLSL